MYLDLCRKAVNEGLKLGATEIEASLLLMRNISAEIERGQIKGCSAMDNGGIGIRAIVNRKIGFAYTNNLTVESVIEAVRSAVKAARASLEDNKWKSLPEPRPYPSPADGYDEKLASLPAERAVEICQEVIDAAVDYSKKVLPAFGETAISIGEVVIVNSHGVEVHDKYTRIECYLAAMAKIGDTTSPICHEFSQSRKYEVNPREIGSKAAELAVKSTKIGRAEPGKFTVIFDPIALASLLTFTFAEVIRGDMVIRGRSPYRDKIGERVASEKISFYDDGTLPGGIYTGKCDLEGVPRQRTPIIINGILEGFIYDSYWANIAEVESTGNAWRGGGGLRLPPYATLPFIQPSNLVLEAKDIVESDLIKEIKNGYYVRDLQGAHQSNPETGEFSVAAVPCWKIENGELKHAVRGVMLAGNVYEIIKNITLVGDRSRQVNFFILPQVAIEGVQVIT